MVDLTTILVKDPRYDGSILVPISDIIDESDLMMISGISKPIIKRPGINKITKFFGYKKDASNIEEHQMTDSYGSIYHIVVCRVCYEIKKADSAELFFAYGLGEASYKNLGPDNGVGACYPVAMAEKRAESRAILYDLGLDFYGEDESPQFYQEKSAASIPESLSEKQKEEIASSWGKKNLIDYAKNICGKCLDMNEQDVKTLFRKILGMEPSAKVSLSELDYDNIVKIVAAVEIKRSLGTKIYESYLEMYSKDLK